MRRSPRKSKEIADSIIKDGKVNPFKSSYRTIDVEAYGHHYLIKKANTENPKIYQLDGGDSDDVISTLQLFLEYF